MAGKRVDRQQNNIDQQYHRANTHSEFPIEIERLKHVLPQENEEQHREIEKITMDVLQDKRKSRLALVISLALAYGAGRRVEKKRAVIRFPIVVTSSAK